MTPGNAAHEVSVVGAEDKLAQIHKHFPQHHQYSQGIAPPTSDKATKLTLS